MRLIYIFSYSRTGIYFLLYVFMTLFGYFTNMSDSSWAEFQKTLFWIGIVISFVIAIWLTIGGFRDLVDLFRTLRIAKRDYQDDGRVTNHQNGKGI